MRTADIDFVYAATADILTVIIRTLVALVISVAALYVGINYLVGPPLDSNTPPFYFVYPAGALIVSCLIRIVLIYCTRRTRIVLATSFSRPQSAAARCFALVSSAHVFDLSITPQTSGADASDEESIIASISALARDAKSRTTASAGIVAPHLAPSYARADTNAGAAPADSHAGGVEKPRFPTSAAEPQAEAPRFVKSLPVPQTEVPRFLTSLPDPVVESPRFMASQPV